MDHPRSGASRPPVWLERTYSVGETLQHFVLPTVVRLNDFSSAVNFTSTNFNYRQKLLLYKSEDCVKVVAQTIFPGYDDLVVQKQPERFSIPQHYSGNNRCRHQNVLVMAGDGVNMTLIRPLSSFLHTA